MQLIFQCHDWQFKSCKIGRLRIFIFYKVGVLSILLGFKNKGTQITGLVFTVYDFKALKSDLDA
jgi:hypothetical protein